MNCLKLQYQDKDDLKVLEAGCGTGALAKELLVNLQTGLSISELVVTDIAEGMLETAKTRLTGYLEPSSEGGGPRVKVEKADFNNFASYGDGYFDRYYANLCLCYAEDPDVVLREACRVLKGGALAGFTAWGRSESSPLMTIVPSVLKDLGLVKEDNKKRSSFHLGEDDGALRSRVLQSGFSRCTVIHFPAAMECFDASNYVELIIDGAASTKAQVESFSKDHQAKVRAEVEKRAKEILDQGLPMQLDLVVILAQK